MIAMAHRAGHDRGRCLTLILNNQDVMAVLTMEDTIVALEEAYGDIASQEAVCRPRIDIRIPRPAYPQTNYQWGTMEGGSTRGYFATRMKSDIVYEKNENGIVTQEKFCFRPGLFCGLIFLTSIHTGEPLAIINDGHLQHMRVGGDGGIGVKYMAKEDASVVGMLGSGGMAESHILAFTRVRAIKRLQVYSPTGKHRELFGRKMKAYHEIDVKVCDRPEDIYEGADIVAACTDSAVPVLDAGRIPKGAHVINIGGGGGADPATIERVDVYLRFGDAPPPTSRPDLKIEDEHLGWEARPDAAKHGDGRRKKRAHGNLAPEKRITLADLRAGKVKGRTSRDQITFSERGNLQGAQFYAVAGRVYEAAKQAGLGHEIPTDWFLQDIRN
jgi:ornithine cyclodeaminase/alanine dehydrogenase-like protein (mu-crystallin family)